jgi:nicotinamidase-related amidase
MNNRSAIIIIDLLKGFFKQNPTLPDPLNAKQLFATVRRVIDIGRAQGLHIVFIKDNFLPEEVPIDKHFKIYGPHCIIGTPDAEIVDELDPKPGDFQIRKKHYSAFNSTRLDAVLRELGRLDRGLCSAHRNRCFLSQLRNQPDLGCGILAAS